MKKALITGITGQDGSYLAELLLDKGYEVHVTDTSVTSTTAVTGGSIDAFNFRQSGSTPNQDLSIGSLRVATTFDEVLIGVPEPASVSLFVGVAAGLLCLGRRHF